MSLDQLDVVTPEHFRSCMGRFATGVTVVTTTDQGGAMHGITVGSFNAVSLDPPLVLFSIGESSSRFGVFSSCTRFIVNVLSDGQKKVSKDFSERKGEQWEDRVFTVVEDVPVIDGVIAYFYCAMHHLYDGGDHKIVVGRVLDCKTLTDANPLLYYRREYWKLGGRVT
ncbi:MAG: flavin reductase family protein [Anaplasma sp.]